MRLDHAQKKWPDAMQMSGKGQGIVTAQQIGKSLYGHLEFKVLFANIVCSTRGTRFRCIFSRDAWEAEQMTAKEALK